MSGYTAITDPSAIQMASYLALRGALRLEIQGLRRRGRPASVIVREVIGSRTRNKVQLLAEFEEALVTYADDAGLPRPLFASR